MTDFDKAFEIVLDLEGRGEVVIDTGGVTKWGISQRAYPDVDIRSLTKEDAKEIYQRDYWDWTKGDALSWPLNIYLFDAAVNQGVTAAIKMLQKAAGGLAVDGIFGHRTLAQTTMQDQEDLAARFMAQRALRYSGTRAFDKYGYGWFSRLFRIASRSR